MDIHDESIGATCVVTAIGRLDGGASAAFADKIGGLIANPNPNLLIDFTGIDFVTSAGLRAVLLLLKKVKATGGAFALCGVRESVREVLDIAGFTGMINIYPARAGAIAAMTG